MDEVSVHIDGSIFTFPAGWEVHEFDKWPEQRRATKHPIESKGCDVVAIDDQRTAWIIEAKDYTYPQAKIPSNLPQIVALKAFHSMAILGYTALDSTAKNHEFARRVFACTGFRICLNVELKDGGRGAMTLDKPLSDIKSNIAKSVRPLGLSIRPIVASSKVPSIAPWTVTRDPTLRQEHVDR